MPKNNIIKQMKNITKVTHPLIEHKLAHIRKKDTPAKEFREYLNEISMLMAYEVLKDVNLIGVSIQTPLTKTIGKQIENNGISIYPILRAGIGMVDGFISLLPTINVGHIGMYRDPKTLKPVEYLFKYPKNSENNLNIILDPMIATGGSAELAIKKLIEIGLKNISFVSIVVAKETIEKLAKQFPNVKFYTAAIDPILNSHGYIEPGLGDAGDRIFGTK
jgi:uracil phosphoribosyltransferase